MTEEDARAWLVEQFGVLQFARLARFVDLLIGASATQNLIAQSTLDHVWSRHIVDSAQLVKLAPSRGHWIDLGSGGGLPGIVVAILRDAPMTLVEPRRKRAEFLADVVKTLRIQNCAILQDAAKNVTGTAAIISARALASIETIFEWAACTVSRETIFVLPRGINALVELETVKLSWQGVFHVEQSITSAASGILVAHGVEKL